MVAKAGQAPDPLPWKQLHQHIGSGCRSNAREPIILVVHEAGWLSWQRHHNLLISQSEQRLVVVAARVASQSEQRLVGLATSYQPISAEVAQ